MENKVRAGDVWWNTKDNYGKMYVQVETGMPTVVRTYLIHNKGGGCGSNQVWESGGLEYIGTVPLSNWKFLYNTNDVTGISLETLKDTDEEHST